MASTDTEGGGAGTQAEPEKRALQQRRGLCIGLSEAYPACQVLRVCPWVCYPLFKGPSIGPFIRDVFGVSVLVAVAGFKEGLEAACGMNIFQ